MNEARQQQQSERQLTPVQQKARGLQQYMMSRQKSFADLLPKHLTPEKMVKGVMAAATRSPKLLECSPESVLICVLQAASMGLEVGRPRGGAYLVPFRNKGRYEATLIPDYRGLMDLAYRSGRVRAIEARPIYANDKFDFAYGTSSFITHVPTLHNRGDLAGVYAVAKMDGADPVFVVLPLEEVNAHRGRSRAKDSGPWADDYTAMALKTAVKVLVNWLPQASELDTLRTAVEMEERQDRGESVADLFGDVIDVSPESARQENEQPTGRSQALKNDLQKTAQPPPEEPMQASVPKTNREAPSDAAPGVEEQHAGAQPPTDDGEPTPADHESAGQESLLGDDEPQTQDAVTAPTVQDLPNSLRAWAEAPGTGTAFRRLCDVFPEGPEKMENVIRANYSSKWETAAGENGSEVLAELVDWMRNACAEAHGRVSA